ncbi:GTP-binding protein, partial [Citrobacter sp. AAK_AS5]
MTTTDIADPQAVASLKARLAALNPGARLLDVAGGEADAA